MTPAPGDLLASATAPDTVPVMRRYPISFLAMFFALALGSAASAVLQQQSWLYAPAAGFTIAAIVYAALRARDTKSPSAE